MVKLQTDYPATISTLFRTGDKFRSIGVSSDGKEAGSECLMCGSQIEESQDCNAYSARLISQRVSRSGPHQLDPNTLFALEDETAACNGGDTTCQNKGLTKTCCNSIGGPLSSEDWNLTLCYGCRVTLQDVVRCLIRFYSYLLILFSHLSFLSLISFFFICLFLCLRDGGWILIIGSNGIYARSDTERDPLQIAAS